MSVANIGPAAAHSPVHHALVATKHVGKPGVAAKLAASAPTAAAAPAAPTAAATARTGANGKVVNVKA